MGLNRNRLYIILSVLLISGYIWFFYVFTASEPENIRPVNLCLFKNLTGLPCPSCGSTRSVVSLFHGNFMEAICLNPIGIIIALIMAAGPFWLIYDILLRKQTLYHFYCRSEIVLRKKTVAFPLISLLLINWIWNIIKEL